MCICIYIEHTVVGRAECRARMEGGSRTAAQLRHLRVPQRRESPVLFPGSRVRPENY